MKRLLVAALLFASSIAAEPAITGISPNAGPLEGGVQVTINGSGFVTCADSCPPMMFPLLVAFGGVVSRQVTVVDANTVIAVAPPHLPKTVDVTVTQNDGSVTRANAFTYSGDVDAAFERVLLPLFISYIDGAHGSRFLSEFRIAPAKSGLTNVFGIVFCHPIHFTPGCGPDEDLSEFPYQVDPGAVSPEWRYDGTPGRFIYIPRSEPQVAMNFRAYDVSRDAHNFGAEIPVVRARELTTAPIKLLGVPTDPRFRNTLRIYATAETAVAVSYSDFAHHVVLRPGVNLFDPAYAQFTDFPTGAGTIDLTITPSTVVPPLPGLVPPRVWAFISVTNNDTQAITTITPQR